MARKSGMHLYQHSTRCSVAMQMFLNCYPHYWIFVPMLSHIAQQHNINYRQSAAAAAELINTTTITTTTTTTSTSHHDLEIQSYLRNIPLAPHGYEFSQQQYHAQIRFFKEKKHQQLPDLPLDLYNASIIVVCKCIQILL